ncbi:MAG: single-stranded-DNA-specific exonuclease RecJ [Candidatus Dadabacteria bacterium]|nr:MAG: single-stranded-DNA-specific exonuclease RecJ [Candidatus Dadabacteria bacterium]
MTNTAAAKKNICHLQNNSSTQNKNIDYISKQFNLHPLAAKLLVARGITQPDQIHSYLYPTIQDNSSDAYQIKGLKKAIDLTIKTISKKNLIGITCDFDVDGLTSASQVVSLLNFINHPYKLYVPDRFKHGYGLHQEIISQCKNDNISLLICLDIGTTNYNQLQLAQNLGIKTIVIDHHSLSAAKNPPPADAFINPAQKNCGFANNTLASAGLTWYFTRTLLKKLIHHNIISPSSLNTVQQIEDTIIQFACLGTVCDMVPLLGINRAIAKKGLEKISTTPTLGIQALKNVAGIAGKVQCSSLAFGLGPRINAAGRIAHAQEVITLLTTNNINQANSLAAKLNKYNQKRQSLEQIIKENAVKIAQKRLSVSDRHLPCLVVWDKKYHIGVIGIVAQRLVEKFKCPTVVIGFEGNVWKGSARSIPGFNIIQAFKKLSHNLISYGGHENAGGLVIEENKIPSFKREFEMLCTKWWAEEKHPCTTPLVDLKITLSEITKELILDLQKFEPFGIGNPRPSFLMPKLKVSSVQLIKNRHLKVIVTDGKRIMPAFFWHRKEDPLLKNGACVNLIATPVLGSYYGIEEIQLMLKSVTPP